MPDDDDRRRLWFAFQLPEARIFVPATSEENAREVLRTHCYRGAPVNAWPLIEVFDARRSQLPLVMRALERGPGPYGRAGDAFNDGTV